MPGPIVVLDGSFIIFFAAGVRVGMWRSIFLFAAFPVSTQRYIYIWNPVSRVTHLWNVNNGEIQKLSVSSWGEEKSNGISIASAITARALEVDVGRPGRKLCCFVDRSRRM